MNPFTKHMLEHIGACTSLREAKAYASSALLAEGIEEQKATMVDVVFSGFDGNSKIDAIKALRNEFDLGLKEAKDVVEGIAFHVFPKIERNSAMNAVKRLAAVGVRTVTRPSA
jgi:ribosomal protein L7/L12